MNEPSLEPAARMQADAAPGPFLSLCIPTFNRVDCLRDLLPRVHAELAAAGREGFDVELVISDNASTDGTEAYVASVGIPGLRYGRNPTNVGADRNCLICIGCARGRYVWLFGDDELMQPGGLVRLLRVLRDTAPVLLELQYGREDAQAGDPRLPVTYASYEACLRGELPTHPVFVEEHMLLTANVFRRDAFDLPHARGLVWTNFSHLHGLLGALKQGGTVVVLDGVFCTRRVRARFSRWPFALCFKGALYFWNLGRMFPVPSLRAKRRRMVLQLTYQLPMEFLSRFLGLFSKRFGRI
jgi:glycosyltransferase involved in cell wall biosynthesis